MAIVPVFTDLICTDLWKARSRLDRRRSSQPNTHFAAFFEIYKTIWLDFQEIFKILQKKISDFRKKTFFFNNPENLVEFCKIFEFCEFLQDSTFFFFLHTVPAHNGRVSGRA